MSMITTLAENEVFVFGSNLQGFHGAGSAGYAMRGTTKNDWRTDKAFMDIVNNRTTDKRGKWAVYGTGRGYQKGITGRSYAIPTVERPGHGGCVDAAFILGELRALAQYAHAHPTLIFKVVKLGANRIEGGYSYLGLDTVKHAWDIIRYSEEGIPGNIELPEEFQ